MDVVPRSPCSLTVSTSRVNGARASVRDGRGMPKGYRKWADPWVKGLLRGRYFLAGAISAEGVFTLGGLAAVPVGECAPAVSNGFCSGGL